MRFNKLSGWTAGIGMVLFVIACLAVMVLQNERQQQRVVNWAQNNGYQIIEIQQPLFDKGPFESDKSNEGVYRLRVRDQHHRERFGWFRLGIFGGVDEHWDDEK